MSTAYVASLAALLIVVVALRVGAPLPAIVVGHRARLTAVDLAALVVGVLAMAAHCASMFDRGLVDHVGPDGFATVVDRLGPASMLLYSVPALLVVVALRHVPPIALIVVAATLVAVGITMYDGGGLSAHLVAIYVAVVGLMLVVVLGARLGSSVAGTTS